MWLVVANRLFFDPTGIVLIDTEVWHIDCIVNVLKASCTLYKCLVHSVSTSHYESEALQYAT